MSQEAERRRIIEVVDHYASAVRGRDAAAVAALFAENFEHVVHGLGASALSPWSTRHETDAAGIRRAYESFFAQVRVFRVDYVMRIVDAEARAVALTVSISGTGRDGAVFAMKNALHLWLDTDGLIVRFLNWYGAAAD